MNHKQFVGLVLVATALSVSPVSATDKSMSFFVTSEGSGKGGDLGGLEGADAHCQKLATAVGVGKKSGEPTSVLKRKASEASVPVTESVKVPGTMQKVY